MIDISPTIIIPLCIEQGSIYHYEFSALRADGTRYTGNRFFIVLNRNPKTDQILILTTITKQIEKQRQYVKNINAAPDTLVPIGPSDFPRLTLDSIVNCNNTYELTLDELIAKVAAGGKVFYDKLPKDTLDAIKRGVLQSNQVPLGHKKLIL
jgi:hypothetical protein